MLQELRLHELPRSDVSLLDYVLQQLGRKDALRYRVHVLWARDAQVIHVALHYNVLMAERNVVVQELKPLDRDLDFDKDLQHIAEAKLLPNYSHYRPFGAEHANHLLQVCRQLFVNCNSCELIV